MHGPHARTHAHARARAHASASLQDWGWWGRTRLTAAGACRRCPYALLAPVHRRNRRNRRNRRDGTAPGCDAHVRACRTSGRASVQVASDSEYEFGLKGVATTLRTRTGAAAGGGAARTHMHARKQTRRHRRTHAHAGAGAAPGAHGARRRLQVARHHTPAARHPRPGSGGAARGILKQADAEAAGGQRGRGGLRCGSAWRGHVRGRPARAVREAGMGTRIPLNGT